MAKSGRKSVAELATIVNLENRTPHAPPSDFNKMQAAIWHNTLANLPHDWIEPPAFALLEVYCRHVSWHQQIQQQIDQAWKDDARLSKLLSIARQESNTIIALGRALRINPHTRVHPKYGRNNSRKPHSTVLPWAQSS